MLGFYCHTACIWYQGIWPFKKSKSHSLKIDPPKFLNMLNGTTGGQRSTIPILVEAYNFRRHVLGKLTWTDGNLRGQSGVQIQCLGHPNVPLSMAKSSERKWTLTTHHDSLVSHALDNDILVCSLHFLLEVTVLNPSLHSHFQFGPLSVCPSTCLHSDNNSLWTWWVG